MTGVVLLLLVLPFASALLTLVAGHRTEAAGRGVAVGASGLALALAWVVALPHLGDAEPLRAVVVGTGAVGPPIELAVNVDPLAGVLLLLAHTVAFLVQVYSLGYLADDPRYPSYAALVSVFTGAMALVVTADDLWLLLVGWEIMGACSYFLIAHHWERPEARAGAVKAFLTTHTADLGLLFAVLLIGVRYDSYRISVVLERVVADDLARDELWLPPLLLTLAVVGKSAQFPLHSWLPDAMPGPTPISALIHAATMVAAGVFLVARMYPLFLASPAVLTLLAAVAGVTMVLAALHALVSQDLKRVLAWSTVSQLAYMFGALAVGAWSAGVFHLLAHGAFKALLFLAAGSVAHAVGTTALAAMGGLRERLPDTFVTMTVGFGALAGVVPLVGFFSKDAVIGATYEAALHGRLVWPWVAWALLGAAVLTAVLTVAYALRAWMLVFLGDPSAGTEDAREPGPAMRLPLYLLLLPTALGGFFVVAPERVLGEAEHALVHPVTSVLMTLLVGASAVAVALWWRRTGGDPWRRSAARQPAVDRLVEGVVVRPVRLAARVVRAGDRDVVQAYADGTGAGARGVGRLLRLAQNGDVQAYLVVVVVGACAAAVLAGVVA